MHQEGPPLESLLRRLAECPAEFLLPPATGADSGIDVTAIVCDHLRAFMADPPPERQASLMKSLGGADARLRRWFALCAWLLHDGWFLARPEFAPTMFEVYRSAELAKLAALVKPELAVQDPDRREELARLCLRALGLRPQGETAAQAADRLTMLDSVERQRVLRATAAAEKRAREVREAMARAQAQESSSRYGE